MTMSKLNNISNSIINFKDVVDSTVETMDSIHNAKETIRNEFSNAKSTSNIEGENYSTVYDDSANGGSNIELESQVYTLNSMEEMETFLSDLQKNASVSIASAIEAQLRVIRDVVYSPNLVDSTISLLIQNLKKSLDNEPSPKIREELKEKFSIMLQNYVFFLDARLQYEIKEHKKEAWDLVEKAGNQLCGAACDLALMAMTSGTSSIKKGTIRIACSNMFSPQNEGLWKKFIGWWTKKKKIEEKQHGFYKTIYKIFQKLSKYQEYIGANILIADVIDRYADEISHNEFYKNIEDAEKSMKEVAIELCSTNLFFNKILYPLIVLILGIITIVVRQIWYWIYDAGTSVASLITDNVEATSTTGWFMHHLLWVLGLTIIVECVCIYKTWKERVYLKECISDYAKEIQEYKRQEAKLKSEIKEMSQKFDI